MIEAAPRRPRSTRTSPRVAEQLAELGAIDVYVLPPHAAALLIDAREKAFWVAKANGADDIVDVVVPRAVDPRVHARRSRDRATSTRRGSPAAATPATATCTSRCSSPTPTCAHSVMHAVFEAGMALGGAISGEHGIGTEKKRYFLELEDPAKIALMRRIKAAFDPNGILNPGTLLG